MITVKDFVRRAKDLSVEEIKDIIQQEEFNIDATDEEGVTALEYSINHNSENLVKALIDCDADVNVRDKDGRTILILACMKGLVGLIEPLLEKGLDINAVNNQGQSAAIASVLSKRVTSFEILAEKGADLTIEDRFKQTALSIAQKRQNQEIIDLITSSETSAIIDDMVELVMMKNISDEFLNPSYAIKGLEPDIQSLSQSNFEKLKGQIITEIGKTDKVKGVRSLKELSAIATLDAIRERKINQSAAAEQVDEIEETQKDASDEAADELMAAAKEMLKNPSLPDGSPAVSPQNASGQQVIVTRQRAKSSIIP